MDTGVGRVRPAEPSFGIWADPVLLLALVGLWVALAIVFHGEPRIDQGVSAFFFAARNCAAEVANPVCGIFPAAASAWLNEVRDLLQYLPVVAAVVVGTILISELAAGRGFGSPRPRIAATVLAAFLLGPGLLVNGILKEFWGRPRPVATDLYGGAEQFVPAGQLSDACASNCSFVSGEAAAIFWLVCLVPLLPARWRRAGAIAIAAVALFTAGLRVAFGGHYMSDVILGGLSSIIVFAALATFAERTANG
jgi:membrane-associated phospholipid phosphatase